jgi:hypothetical protein
MRGVKKTARDWIELGKQLKVDELGWARCSGGLFCAPENIINFWERKEWIL